ncbi:MAG: UbiA-like polyprenyltransferase [Fimbriimonadaceae bacterium]
MAEATGLKSVLVFLETVKIEHSVFALPFAMVGMVLASVEAGGGAWPGWRIAGWIVLAMVAARTSAMAFNRIVDRESDAANPRTQMRAIPAGLLSLRKANLYFIVSLALFFLSAWQLNALALALSPVALIVILGYSLAKRFTWLCHWVLGLGLGIAPAAAWIGVTEALDPRIVWATTAVSFWTAGFDLIYSLQDERFDRESGLFSVPSRFGSRGALAVSRASHSVAVLCLCGLVWSFGLGAWAWIGVALAAALLAYEQSLVRHDDLSRVNAAFFTMNGFVSIGFFAFLLADVLGRHVA